MGRSTTQAFEVLLGGGAGAVVLREAPWSGLAGRAVGSELALVRGRAG